MKHRADDYMTRYLHHKNNPCELQAQNPIEAEGIMYVENCLECGSKDAAPMTDSGTEVKSPSGAVCTICKSPWETRTEYRFIGEVRTAPDKASAHRRAGAMADLGIQYDRFMADKAIELEAQYYIASCAGWSLRELVEDGPGYFGDHAPTTVYGVRKLVMNGREEWAIRMRKIGIKVA